MRKLGEPPESLHDNRTRWQTATDAQMAKLDQDKIRNHYGYPNHQTEIMNTMTPTKDHLHHTIVTTITTNDLAMIVDNHHHKIAPTPKCAVRAAQATITKTIIDKAHHSTMERKDTKNKHKINE
jgi:hypothetical protein